MKSEKLFTASILFSSNENKAKNARILALNLIYLNEYDRCSHYIKISDKIEQNVVLNELLKIIYYMKISEFNLALKTLENLKLTNGLDLTHYQVFTFSN